MKIVAKILIFMHFLSLYHTINTYNFVLNYCVKYSYYNNMSFKHFRITLSWRRPLSYRNQSIGSQWTGFYMMTASVVKEIKGIRKKIKYKEKLGIRLAVLFIVLKCHNVIKRNLMISRIFLHFELNKQSVKLGSSKTFDLIKRNEQKWPAEKKIWVAFMA